MSLQTLLDKSLLPSVTPTRTCNLSTTCSRCCKIFLEQDVKERGSKIWATACPHRSHASSVDSRFYSINPCCFSLGK